MPLIEQLLRAHLRIHAELLGQIAECLPDLVLLAQHVELAQVDGAFVRILKRRDHAHQRRLSSAVRPEQPEHAGGDGEADISEGAHAVRIRPRDIADAEVHGHTFPSSRQSG